LMLNFEDDCENAVCKLTERIIVIKKVRGFISFRFNYKKLLEVQ